MENLDWSLLTITIFTTLPIYVGLWWSLKEVKRELLKFQKSRNIDNMGSIYEYVFSVISDASKVVNDRKMKENLIIFEKELMKYGSKDALAIFATYIELLYKEKADGLQGLYFFAILASQLRFDTTGVWISPLIFLRIRLNDLNINQTTAGINNVIRSYGFNHNLVVK